MEETRFLKKTLDDALCKLTLNETSDFVKSLPLPNKSRTTVVDTPPYTPGRPIFGFTAAAAKRKSIPSKWDDAGKWISSPSHQNSVMKQPPQHHQEIVYSDKSRVTTVETVEASSRPFSVTQELLTDKFTDDARRMSDPSKQGFLFQSSVSSSSSAMKDAATDVIPLHKDVGTDMTPHGSSTHTRCPPTPYKILSPPRHNTPDDRSGPLSSFSGQCHHLAKLNHSITTTWSSREEEEEDVSKSLRHFDADFNPSNAGFSKITSNWEEDENHKCFLRYQREDAKIQAWINLENAKAEAQSRKLELKEGRCCRVEFLLLLEPNASFSINEVKIQKMRSKLEEKLMKRMSIVHRKAEEWRAAARHQHQQHSKTASAEAKKMPTMVVKQRRHSHVSSSYGCACGCFPPPALY